ncbi:MAG: hypothetical protein AB1447_04780 [Bacillota bacterium]
MLTGKLKKSKGGNLMADSQGFYPGPGYGPGPVAPGPGFGPGLGFGGLFGGSRLLLIFLLILFLFDFKY